MYRARAVRVMAAGRAILDGVDLVLTPGKVVAVVGPNGAGKSTLLKVMAGERRPDGGEVILEGYPLADWSVADLASRRAVLPQSVHLAFPFLVGEVVAIGLPKRIVPAMAARLVNDALRAVELGDFRDRVYGELSGGEQQRVQLARVLLQVRAEEGGYLLLDEPTTSLDLSHQLLTLRLARAHAVAGGGVMMVLHDLNLAAMAADEIVALKDGRVVGAGAPADVITDSLIGLLYGVRAEVCGVPDGPFLLPQTAQTEVRSEL